MEDENEHLRRKEDLASANGDVKNLTALIKEEYEKRVAYEKEQVRQREQFENERMWQEELLDQMVQALRRSWAVPRPL